MSQKKLIQNILSFLKILTITTFFSALAFVFLATSPFVFDSLHHQKSSQIQNLKNQKFFSIKVQNQKLPPMQLFKFPGIRESEEKLFTIKLNDLEYILSIKLSLAYPPHPLISQELNDKLYFIQDRIQLIISSKSYFDLNTSQKREKQLKKELINDINSFLQSGKIAHIYFSQFLITKNQNHSS